MYVNPLSPNIKIQILQTDLHTFPFKNELREFDKRSRHFYLGDHFINSQTVSVDSLWILLGENWSWSLLGLEGVSDGPDKKESTNHNEHIQGCH